MMDMMTPTFFDLMFVFLGIFGGIVFTVNVGVVAFAILLCPGTGCCLCITMEDLYRYEKWIVFGSAVASGINVMCMAGC